MLRFAFRRLPSGRSQVHRSADAPASSRRISLEVARKRKTQKDSVKDERKETVKGKRKKSAAISGQVCKIPIEPNHFRRIIREDQSLARLLLDTSDARQPFAQAVHSTDVIVRFAEIRDLQSFFNRSDTLFFQTEDGSLDLHESILENRFSVFTASAFVVCVEGIIGYKFKSRMTCVEALSPKKCLLIWNGRIEVVESYQRLALLGDRVLALMLCDIWSDSRSRPHAFGKIPMSFESRPALYERGMRFELHKFILAPKGKTPAQISESHFFIAETVEAIIGAVYVDSDKNLDTAKQVLHKLGFEHDVRLHIEREIEKQDTWERQRHRFINPFLGDSVTTANEKISSVSSAENPRTDNRSSQLPAINSAKQSILTDLQDNFTFPEFPDLGTGGKCSRVLWKMAYCQFQLAKNPSALASDQHRTTLRDLEKESKELEISADHYSQYTARINRFGELVDLYDDFNKQVHLLTTRMNAVGQNSQKRIADQIKLLNNWLTYFETRGTAAWNDVLTYGGSILEMIADDQSVRSMVIAMSSKQQIYHKWLRKRMKVENVLAAGSPIEPFLRDELTTLDKRIHIVTSTFPHLLEEPCEYIEKENQTSGTVDREFDAGGSNTDQVQQKGTEEEGLPTLAHATTTREIKDRNANIEAPLPFPPSAESSRKAPERKVKRYIPNKGKLPGKRRKRTA